MKKFHLFSVCTLLSLFCISGCGKQVPEMTSDFLMEHGEEIVQAIDNGLDAMQEYGPIYRDVYIAEVAPADNPEQVFHGRT